MTSIPLPSPAMGRNIARVVTLLLLAVLGAASVVYLPQLDALRLWPILAALGLTAISFWSLGQYDVIWHRICGLQTLPVRAHRSGMAGIAIGQTLGASSLTSATIRRISLPELRHRDIAQISAGVALSFTACWSLLALVALGAAGTTALFQAPAPLLVIGLTCGIAVALTRLARQKLIRLRDALRLIIWTGVDLTAAALALYLLLPGDLSIGLTAFWGIFVLAMGAGILSHLPGGIGPFELVLITCLPHDNTGALVASILVFRIIYYALPFTLAALWLQRRANRRVLAAPLRAPPPGTPAIWGLAQQSGYLMSTRSGALHLGQVPFGLVSLGDPQGARIPTLQALAGQAGAWTAVYQASRRVALRLRRMGWTLAHVADEALIAPQDWTDAGRSKQTLRRKIRQAKADHVTITYAADCLPHADMHAIARNWARHHRGEMGFSMGRYAPDYVAEQAVFLIYHDTVLCGFVTFHKGPHDWALDLIRHTDALPQGAIQMAIVAAITAARRAGIMRLSLAAVPPKTGPFAPMGRNRSGLRQFKQCFGPSWEPRYHVAPSPLAFWVTGLGIAWCIQRPAARLIYWIAEKMPIRVTLHPETDWSFQPQHATSLPNGEPAPPAPNEAAKLEGHHDKRTVKAA